MEGGYTGRESGQGREQEQKSAKLIKNERSFFSEQRAGSEVFKCQVLKFVLTFLDVQFLVIV